MHPDGVPSLNLSGVTFLAVALLVALTSRGPAASAVPSGSLVASSHAAAPSASAARRLHKVMVIAEENHTYEEVFGLIP